MDNRAIAPVVATILLVAVVVILAAVISVFVLDIGEDVDDPAPAAGFDFDWEKSTRTVTITHDGGDVFDAQNTERLEVVIRDEDDTGMNDYLVARSDWANDSNGGFPVSAGDTFVITGENGGGDLDVEQSGVDVSNTGQTHEPEVNDPVTVIWYGPGDRSLVVAEYEIPSGED